MQRGQIFGHLNRLDLLYQLSKCRIPAPSTKVFPTQVKLAQTPKFRPAFPPKLPKSPAEFVLLRSRLRAVLPDLDETSFGSQSYIYLQITLTEFFVTSPFSFYKAVLPVFTLSAMGGPSLLWGWEGPLFHTQNNTRAFCAERSLQ